MPLCELLHKSIVASGGNKNDTVCEICQIAKQVVLDTGIIARIIPEQKQKEWLDQIKPDSGRVLRYRLLRQYQEQQ